MTVSRTESTTFSMSLPLCSLPSRGLGTRVDGGQKDSGTCHAHGRLQPENSKGVTSSSKRSKVGKHRYVGKQASKPRLQQEGGGDSMQLDECARENGHADASDGARGVEEPERLASELRWCRLGEEGGGTGAQQRDRGDEGCEDQPGWG